MNTVTHSKLDLPKLNLPLGWYTDKVQLEAKVGGYIAYYVTEDVDRQIRSLFPEDFFPPKTHIVAQFIDSRLNNRIHKDKRMYAINYMLNKGGYNACTSVYSDDNILEHTYVQEHKEWYLLNTFTNHAVHNITDTRLAISISFYDFGEKQWEWLNEKLQSK